MQHAEPEGQHRVAPGWRRGQGPRAEYHQTQPHQRHRANRQRSTAGDRGAVEQQPRTGKVVDESAPIKAGREDGAGGDSRRESQRELARRRPRERHARAVRLLHDGHEPDGPSHDGVRQPDREPPPATSPRVGDQGGDERRRTHQHAAPARHRAESGGSLHRGADVLQALGGVGMQALRLGGHHSCVTMVPIRALHCKARGKVPEIIERVELHAERESGEGRSTPRRQAATRRFNRPASARDSANSPAV
jgi:hypothetical protein